ncbi:MAG: hypothetical protein ACON42_09340 [Flavobacteriaceae bacterium]
MTRIRLEIDHVKIHRPKKRWNLYFVVVTDHPTEADKKILTTLPEEFPIGLHRIHNNEYQFDTDQEGSEGLLVFSGTLPQDREKNIHLHLFHTRKPLRSLGENLADIEGQLGGDAFGIVQELLGNSTPWLVFASKAVPMVGRILAKIPDRKLGFVSCFERFGAEFESEAEIDREKHFSGPASLVYSWSVEA